MCHADKLLFVKRDLDLIFSKNCANPSINQVNAHWAGGSVRLGPCGKEVRIHV